MGIRCSIFGCEYEGTEIEREEERRGSEVVTTVREYEECVHCGNVRIVSENTGVTAAEPPDVDPAGGEGRPDLREVIVEAEPDPGDAGGADPAPADAGPDPADRPSTADPAGGATGGNSTPDPTGPPGTPGEVTDDAVFIDDADETRPDPGGPADGSPGEAGDPATGSGADREERSSGPGTPGGPDDGTAPDEETTAPDGSTAPGGSTPPDAPVEPHPDEDVEIIDAGGEDSDAGSEDPDAGSEDSDAGGEDSGDPATDDTLDRAAPEGTPGDPAPGGTPGGTDDPELSGTDDPAPGGPADAGDADDEAVIIEDEPPSLADAISEAEGEVTDATDRPDDDAVIIDDGDDRSNGTGPRDATVDDHDWPTFGSDDPADADPDGGAEFVDGALDGGGATAGPGGETVAESPDAGGDGATRAAPRPGGPRTTEDWTAAPGTDAARELHCPECGGSWPVAETSLRAGDWCPDCSLGDLTER